MQMYYSVDTYANKNAESYKKEKKLETWNIFGFD